MGDPIGSPILFCCSIRWLGGEESHYGIATPVVNQIREYSEIAATQLFKYTLSIMFQKKLHVPRTKQGYQEAVDMLDNLIDEVGETEEHPLALLMELVGCRWKDMRMTTSLNLWISSRG